MGSPRRGLRVFLVRLLGLFRVSPIILVRRVPGAGSWPTTTFSASVKGTEICARGTTASSAVGALIRKAPEYFPIRVEVHGECV